MTAEQLQRIAACYFIWDAMGARGRSIHRRTFGSMLAPESPIGWWLTCLLFIDHDGDYNRAFTWSELWPVIQDLAVASGEWPSPAE